jgi:pyruvate formate lyase activating enzyme
MKSGIVFDFKKYSIHDGPGIRTTVFLKGCPLSCWWCHNPESISPQPAVLYRPERCIGCGACLKACQNGAITATPEGFFADPSRCTGCGACADACPSTARERVGRLMTSGEVLAVIRKDIPFYDESGGGATFSGGEPLLQPEFLWELLEGCRKLQIHTAVDTTGFAQTSVLLETARLTDLFLYDIKHMDPEKHKFYTGVDNTLILENLKALTDSGARVAIRIPLIPGINDDEENLRQTGRFVSALKGVVSVHLLPYHAAARNKYAKWKIAYRLPDTLPPSAEAQEAAANSLKSFGLNVLIGG